MKTKFKLILLSSILANSLQAGANYGIISSKFADGDSGYGVTIGVDDFFYQPENLNGFGIGYAGDMNYFSIGDIKGIDDDMGFDINLDLIAGYSKDKVTTFVGIGYGTGVVGSEGFDGINYQASLSYDITENSGIGIKYNHNDCDLAIGKDSTVDLDMISIYYKYTKNK
jgi:hypothetical protein